MQTSLVVAGALAGSMLVTAGVQTAPSVSPATTVVVTAPQQAIKYPEGRYELCDPSLASTAAEDLVPRSFGRTAPGLRAEARARHA